MNSSATESHTGTEDFGKQLKRQRRLSDQVADALRDEILRRNLLPGDKLPSERRLGEQFNVSRTVIREAVRTLITKGLVEVQSGSGLSVASADEQALAESLHLFMITRQPLDYDHLHDVRMVLELAIVERAVSAGSSEQANELSEICDQMADSLDNLELASRLDLQFHQHIAEMTGNTFFVMLHSILCDPFLQTRRTTFAYDHDRMPRVVLAHRTIAEAIAARDVDTAKELMQEHLQEVYKTWKSIQAESDEVTGPAAGSATRG